MFNWSVLPNPPYSTNLAPTDYYFFPISAKRFDGGNFSKGNQIQEFAKNVFKSKSETFYSNFSKRCLISDKLFKIILNK